MLPVPNVARLPGKSRIHYPTTREPHTLSTTQHWLQSFRNRSRFTHFVVYALVFLLGLYLFLHSSHHLPPLPLPIDIAKVQVPHRWSPFAVGGAGAGVKWRGWDDKATRAQLDSGIPLSLETTVVRDARWAEIDHLIMVPGHAIWLGHDPSLVEEDTDWVLEPIQKGGSVKTYIKHIKEGVEKLRQDPNSILVFSGGATRPPPSPFLPEGISYLTLAHALKLIPDSTIAPIPHEGGPPPPIPINLRATAEEFALDSYENLLFSIARFKEMTGRWPEKITVVGYGMKRRRFETLHRAAIAYPADKFTYIGIDDEGDTTANYAGELKYGYTPFLSSPAGCHPPLSIKRQLRNPFFRYHSYHTSCPELIPLFEWCPPIDMTVGEDAHGLHTFQGDLPWRRRERGSKEWGRENY